MASFHTAFLLLCLVTKQAYSDCTFRTTDLSKNMPLVLKPTGTDDDRFIMPKRQTDILLFQREQKILLACPGKKNAFIVDGIRRDLREVNATCVQGKSFKIDNTITHFQNIICSQIPDSSLRVTGQCRNSKKSENVQIGFQLPMSKQFVKMMELCYDPMQHATLYTEFKISKGIKNGQKMQRSGYFKTELFRDNLKPTFSNIYKGQKSRFQMLLGRDLGERNGILQKGHLAAYANFPYHFQQEATMYAINTIPQFRGVNTGNWKKLEDKLRSYATEQDQDLHVYVGTYNVLKLPADNGKQTEIYLSNNGKVNVVPVPEMLYAVVYNQAMTRGVVFVTVNNIVVRSTPRKLCRDHCSQVTWFTNNWKDRTDATKGYVYCCNLKDFLRKTGLSFPEKPLLT